MNHLVMAAGILGDVKLISADLKDIFVNLLPPVFGAAFVLWTWGHSKSPLKTFVACIAAGAIWWGIANMDLLRDKTGEDINQDKASAAVLHVPVTPGPRAVSGGEPQ
ncbi:hypothetical protein [Streptomyces sp. NPDC017964]|uniref:hypothetical protein n=1 Tax=Streptomyces sp. NPDC017964 TaxID=3365022 RepID=UPI0037875D7D